MKPCQTENCMNKVSGKRSYYCIECLTEKRKKGGKIGGDKNAVRYIQLDSRVKYLEKQLRELKLLLNNNGG